MVNEIKLEKSKSKTMKQTIIDLQAKLEERKVEASMNIIKARDEIAAKEREEQGELDRRKKLISYYDEFNKYER